jgi:hypothetical protein
MTDSRRETDHSIDEYQTFDVEHRFQRVPAFAGGDVLSGLFSRGKGLFERQLEPAQCLSDRGPRKI